MSVTGVGQAGCGLVSEREEKAVSEGELDGVLDEKPSDVTEEMAKKVPIVVGAVV